MRPNSVVSSNEFSLRSSYYKYLYITIQSYFSALLIINSTETGLEKAVYLAVRVAIHSPLVGKSDGEKVGYSVGDSLGERVRYSAED